MTNKNQSSDSSQGSIGTRVNSVTPQNANVKVGVPSAKDGQTAGVSENRNKRS